MKEGKKVILLVEDEYRIRKMIQEFLELNDFFVISAEDGGQALELFFANNRFVDLVILDLMLPVMDGNKVLKEIRQLSEVPTIILSAKNSVNDQVSGLNEGADDYMTKPFSLKLLKAHIDSLLRRTLTEESEVVVRGKLSLNERTREGFLDEKPLMLLPREFDLLLFFMKNEHIVFTRNSILNSVWGYMFNGDIRTVDTHVKQIRAKLTSKYPYIHSVYGVGYKFEVKDA